MLQTLERPSSGRVAISSPVPLPVNIPIPKAPRISNWAQVARFGLVGGLNTLVDVLILNGLLLFWPTSSTLLLLAYNSLAYSLGAVNSFLLNKYWTFGRRQQTTRRELARFSLTILCGIGWSTGLLWLASTVLHPVLVNPTIWANASKVFAIGGTALISYFGMRLWVFVSQAPASPRGLQAPGAMLHRYTPLRLPPPSVSVRRPEQTHSLSVVLPAYNEAAVIASTVTEVLNALCDWRIEAEVLVVNDGSTDETEAIVTALAEAAQNPAPAGLETGATPHPLTGTGAGPTLHPGGGTKGPQVRLISHPTNQGYGAALVSGFAATTKELTLFMDADGQFDIRDLRQFFPFIDEYDAVLGYRLNRQDSLLRKLNAWGWKCLIGWVLGVHVRDIDCAFKLLHTEFLQQHPLETRGAMINAELLDRLTRAGGTYREIGVRHLPRRGGRATGAKLRVILRALRELFTYARRRRVALATVPGHSHSPHTTGGDGRACGERGARESAQADLAARSALSRDFNHQAVAPPLEVSHLFPTEPQFK